LRRRSTVGRGVSALQSGGLPATGLDLVENKGLLELKKVMLPPHNRSEHYSRAVTQWHRWRSADGLMSTVTPKSGRARQSTLTFLHGDRMSDFTLVKRHSLPIAKVKVRVQKVADELAAEYALSSEWHGNTLRFHRSGVDGRVHVTGSEIRLDVTLGFLLKPLKGKFVNHIERSFDKVLSREPRAQAKKPTRKTARQS
jgi:putative polyhydroxyalkanoate system protein